MSLIEIKSLLDASVVSCLIFLAILALSKKSNTPSGYRYLSLLFILLSFIFINELIENKDIYTRYTWLVVVLEPLLYAFAPIIYLSVFHLTSIRKNTSHNIALHFIPYAMLLGLYLNFYITDSFENTTLSDEDMDDDKSLEIILLSLFFVQIGFYLYASIRKLNKHKQVIPLFVSNISDNDYHWLFKTIIGLSLLVLVSFIEAVFDQLHIQFYFSLFYLIGFYYIGVQVAKQKDVFEFSNEQSKSVIDLVDDQEYFENKNIGIQEKTHSENNDIKDRLPDRKKLLSEEKLDIYKVRLLEIMEREKPYLDSEITLPKLGKMLFLNTYQTSYLINTCFGENFYTFINRYRLEECKKMLLNHKYDHLTILGIAFESGFNSKTTFNTTFKKQTGLSPKEFKEQRDKVNQGEISSDLSTD